jgi:hypothetical protein
MAEGFKAFDPKAEVIGLNMLSNLHNMNKANFAPILTKYGISEVDPQHWYSQQMWLDVLHEVVQSSNSAMFDLVAVGISVADLTSFPPEVNTLPKAFTALEKLYTTNHRGGYVGELVCESAEDGKIIERMNSPYPDDFLYGLAYGIAKRFLPREKSVTVIKAIKNNICYFTITW